jgi:hypothetical protein
MTSKPDVPTPTPSNDNNTEGTKINIGDGKSVVIKSDLDNTHLGGHVTGGDWKGPVGE